MKKDEALFFKHRLIDYPYYVKQVDKFRQRLMEIDTELEAMIFPKIRYGGISNQKDPYKTIQSSMKYQNLLEEREMLQKKTVFYLDILTETNEFLNGIDEPIKSILTDIYVKGMSADQVARKNYYSDKSSLYRAIRKIFTHDKHRTL